MEYQVLTVAQRADLLRQRLVQIEQAHFESEVELTELNYVMKNVTVEEQGNARQIILGVEKRLLETAKRITAVKSLLKALAEPKAEAVQPKSLPR